MTQYSIPWTTYTKAYFHRTQNPNVYRDNARTRLKDVVFANKDYFQQDEPKVPVRKYEEIHGGLPKPLKLPWNHLPMTDDEEILERIMACEIDEPLFKPDFTYPNKRQHIRLTSGRRQTYLPCITPIMTMPSDGGNLVATIHHTFILPDYPFIKDTQQGLMMWFKSTSQGTTQVASIFVNPCLVNLRFFSSETRDSIIRHLAKTIKNQENLEQFTFENAFLYLTDAIRVVAAAALGAGDTLQKLYLANLFSPQALPIETESEYFDVYNEFEYDPEDVPIYSDEMKANVWKSCLERACFHELSPSISDKYLQISLSSFTNLTVLMVDYTWLSKGNGSYLLRLGSIRNGKLRKLILILSPSQHPNNSRQIICHKAWIEALKLCPDLELHMVLSQNVCHMEFIKVFVRSMPLASVHLSSIYPTGDLNKQKPWFFSYTTRFLWSYFGHTLKMITLEVWQPTTRVDVSIANCILKCPFLRVFLYRGHMDKLDTIDTICEFLIDAESMRLRKISFIVSDDACRPEGWSEALDKVQNRYQVPLALKGIYLHLGVWKF